MQSEIKAERPDLSIQLLAINMVNNWSNGLTNEMAALGNLPIVQDNSNLNVWQSWNGQWRDVVILDAENQAVEYFNANDNNLGNSQNYDLLKQTLITVAENQ